MLKKNELTDKHYGKGSKGFYAALGISAVMVAAACLFAHKQGDAIPNVKTSAVKTPIAAETPVGRRVTDIPKATSPAYSITSAIVTAPPIMETIPAAEITVDAPFEVADSFTEKVQPAAAAKGLDNACAPLSDISGVIEPFSSGELVKNATTGTWQTHNGTDIAAEVGSDVMAVENGEISSVTNDPLWGVTVVLDHKNGFFTRYCGLGADLAVQQGDTVSRGDIIGAVGQTADIESAEAPHLHIEITHNGAFVDPMTVFK
ncbi:M23 family metallopeptidase [Ruminococcus flavefaciens]|uniref:M23 family metallopeptidase n=1 Tax=Ruminococcus flavefaciens TaxID=1265 RepID=UPI001FA7F196|nr:M23 family metallopeptidase [Ruminococcus flavefaciens]